MIRRLDLARKNDKKILKFWCFDQPLVVLESIIELLRKSKKIKKKSLSFFHAFGTQYLNIQNLVKNLQTTRSTFY
jgi:hypothetical protein